MKFELPKLAYTYDALEPYVDAKTMELHHSKHHQTYLDKFNAVLEKYPDLSLPNAEDFLIQLKDLKVEEADRAQIKNHGGGFVNHDFFWKVMAPKKEVDNALVDELTKEFGSVDEFKKVFTDASVKHFGSGWTWLVNSNGKLKVYSLPNQDSPLTAGDKPLLALDLWEHSYYLKYQNRRAEYIDAWWNIVKSI